MITTYVIYCERQMTSNFYNAMNRRIATQERFDIKLAALPCKSHTATYLLLRREQYLKTLRNFSAQGILKTPQVYNTLMRHIDDEHRHLEFIFEQGDPCNVLEQWISSRIDTHSIKLK